MAIRETVTDAVDAYFSRRGILIAVLVHAIDAEARAFHEFETCPEDELRLMLLMKDLGRMMGLGS